ncbi:MAG: nitrilase-related carbon-nitrogen hydrolase [Planctomycetota bacterium]
MSQTLKVAAVQFEPRPSHKEYNLAVMENFVAAAHKFGVQLLAFPEMCLTGYTHLTNGTREDFAAVAEAVPDGPSIETVRGWVRDTGMAILFGLVETGANGVFHNTYVACTPEGPVHAYRKLHAFEHSCIQSGDRFLVFETLGWQIGTLICYDNNLPENVRCTALLGAEILVAPHQTGGFDIEIAGMGRIPLDTWQRRETDPVAIREAILGLKGREWLLKWMPARAYDNNLFYIFSNGVGVDGEEIRTGNSMILDPHGRIMAETQRAGDDMVIALLDKSMREKTLGRSHMLTRRPDLYAPITAKRDGMDTREARNAMTKRHKIG